ncbi:MAG: branched-chain amino acid transport system II carrier protein, partial [Candidatus Dependentiae bacterium]
VDLLVLIMIGPLTGLPRAITVLHELILKNFPNLPLFDFSVGFLFFVFLVAHRRDRVMSLLGYLISPVLFGLLLTIIGIAWHGGMPLPVEGLPPFESFWRGVREGYTTMDLMAAFHFAPLATTYLRRLSNNERFGIKSVTRSAVAASLITSILLSSVYIGLSYIGALYGTKLNTHNPVSLAYTITRTLLPGWLVGVFYLVIFLAITSTAISLATIFTDYLHENVATDHITYPQALLFTIILSGFSANGGLHAILKLELPFLIIFYPPLIMLALCNIAYKLWGVQHVRLPVALSFLPGLYYFLIF